MWPSLRTRIRRGSGFPTYPYRGAVFVSEIDGGQVTASVTDASSSPRSPAGSSEASTEAVLVTAPHATSSVSRTSNETAALAPAGREDRVQVTDQCSGAGGATEETTVHWPPGNAGTRVVARTPSGRSSCTCTSWAVAAPPFATVMV